MNQPSSDEVTVPLGSDDPMPADGTPANLREMSVSGHVGGLLARLPRPALHAVLRRLQRSTRPSKKLVPERRVLRERVGRAGDTALGVPVTWIDKPLSRSGTILHLHGGAYVASELPMHWRWLEELGRRVGAAVALVHYRMPPRAPFPAALDDALTVIRGLVDRADLIEGRWVLTGDSAGGGLAVAVLQQLRDTGGPLPAAVVLLSPATDLTLEDPLIQVQEATDVVLDVDFLHRCASEYAGPFPVTDPRVSPRFGSVEGLPPVLLFTGTQELLLGDARHLRDALEAAGAPFAYVEQPGGQHVYPLLETSPATQWAMRRSVAFVRRALGRDA